MVTGQYVFAPWFCCLVIAELGVFDEGAIKLLITSRKFAPRKGNKAGSLTHSREVDPGIRHEEMSKGEAPHAEAHALAFLTFKGRLETHT